MRGGAVGMVLVPTLLGAGTGAAMSLVAKPQYRGAIIGTGAAFGGLIGLSMAGFSGAFQEKSKTVGTSDAPSLFSERISFGARTARFP